MKTLEDLEQEIVQEAAATLSAFSSARANFVARAAGAKALTDCALRNELAGASLADIWTSGTRNDLPFVEIRLPGFTSSDLSSAKAATDANRLRVTAFLARHETGVERLTPDHPLVRIVGQMRTELAALEPPAK